jgi:hypothetical protein
MVISLLNKSTLTFQRDGGDGYWDEHGEWIPSTPVVYQARGNLQPFQEGKEQTILPEGKTSNDAFLFYTKTQINTASQFTKELADTTVVDGLTYYALAVEDWSKQPGLLPTHWKIVLLRNDQPTNGGF